MKCCVCQCDALNPQYVWLIDTQSKGCKTVIEGVFVACQGPDCAGHVCESLDRKADVARQTGHKWMLMDCAATPAQSERLLRNYDWTGANIKAPASGVS